jgi:hypothetical protein
MHIVKVRFYLEDGRSKGYKQNTALNTIYMYISLSNSDINFLRVTLREGDPINGFVGYSDLTITNYSLEN